MLVGHAHPLSTERFIHTLCWTGRERLSPAAR